MNKWYDTGTGDITITGSSSGTARGFAYCLQPSALTFIDLLGQWTADAEL